MKNLLVMLLLMLVSCTEKTKPNFDQDFNDRVVTFAVENRDDKYIELGDLYESRVNYIPKNEDDKLILAEKLKMRGFSITDLSRADYQLLGRRIITITLVKGDCKCEVGKVYYTTPNVSEYIRTERIRCSKIAK